MHFSTSIAGSCAGARAGIDERCAPSFLWTSRRSELKWYAAAQRPIATCDRSIVQKQAWLAMSVSGRVDMQRQHPNCGCCERNKKFVSGARCVQQPAGISSTTCGNALCGTKLEGFHPPKVPRRLSGLGHCCQFHRSYGSRRVLDLLTRIVMSRRACASHAELEIVATERLDSLAGGYLVLGYILLTQGSSDSKAGD